MNLQIRNVFAVAALMAAGLPSITLAQASDASTHAKPANEDIWTRDKLTGEWGGLRTDLTKHGIDVDLRLSQYWQGVTSGGRDEHDEYGGTMDYQVNLDGPKLFGSWDGFSINIHARTRFGEDINAEAGELVIPNTGMMMPAPGDYHDTDITGFIASQYLPFFNDGLANVTVGKLDVVDTVNGFFPNLAKGQEGFMNINSTVSALPWFGAVRGLSLYGAVGVTVNQDYGMPQSGIVVTGTENVSTTNGQFADSFDDVWLAAFHRFLWRIDNKPGYLMFFAGASTADQVANIELDHVKIPGAPGSGTDYLIPEIESDEEKPWDVAVYYHQEFWQAQGDPTRRAFVKIGGTAGPDDPQFSQYNAFGHVEFLGLMDSRPYDRMGAGMWWNSLSDNYKDVVAFLGEDLQDLYGAELYYNFQIIPSVHLTADVQYVQNEWKEDDNAVIVGGRLVIDF